MIKLGQKVKDKITGFTGIAVAKAEYLTGCTQIGISPPMGKDGKLGESMYFDWTRLEVLDSKPIEIISDQTPKKDIGGPNRDAPRG